MNVSILGAGESGTGAALLAKQKGLTVFISDSSKIADKYKKLLTTYQIPYEEGGHTVNKLKTACEVIKSPGIPNNAPIVIALQKYTIPIIDEITFAARYAKGNIIAVTGSNGKTTTVHLIHHLLKASGYKIALTGNVGYSFAKAIAKGNYKDYILELSSFQLERIGTLKPTIACLLNITPDHLDHYNYSMETYAKAKWKLLSNMTSSDHFIYNKDDVTIQTLLDKHIVIPHQYPMSRFPHPPIFSTKDGYHFNIQNHSFTIRRKITPLLGPHNQYNTMAAVTAAWLMGMSLQDIVTALSTFHGLPHRLEWCGKLQGIDCYNDSKATNVAATAVALASFNQPIVWIAGGKDKGNDYTTLLPIVKEKVKAMVFLGKNNDTIIQAFKPLGLPMKETNHVCTALQHAFSFALPTHAVILLSPACASFDLFKNFEDRGNQFKAAVQAFKER